jgi:uncharacterized RDD family membrane protein YckC
MRKIKITTPENIEVEYTLADVASRSAAAFIDFLIQGAILFVLLIAVILIAYVAPAFWKEYYGWIVGISLFFAAVIFLGYFIGMELSMNGMTLGKKLLKIRTIRNNGQPITLKHSAIRNLFKIFADMTGLGVVFIFFNKNRKRLGDMVASTIVISEEYKMRPITLESLEKSNENFGYYISEEEQDILRDYLQRRSIMEDCSILRSELKEYFTKKFEDLGILNDWQEFINKL